MELCVVEDPDGTVYRYGTTRAVSWGPVLQAYMAPEPKNLPRGNEGGGPPRTEVHCVRRSEPAAGGTSTSRRWSCGVRVNAKGI